MSPRDDNDKSAALRNIKLTLITFAISALILLSGCGGGGGGGGNNNPNPNPPDVPEPQPQPEPEPEPEPEAATWGESNWDEAEWQ